MTSQPRTLERQQDTGGDEVICTATITDGLAPDTLNYFAYFDKRGKRVVEKVLFVSVAVNGTDEQLIEGRDGFFLSPQAAKEQQAIEQARLEAAKEQWKSVREAHTNSVASAAGVNNQE